jgi:GxxExxY protein
MCTTKTTKGEDPTFAVIGCAIEVHRLLGPGLLESAYEQCLAYELSQKGINFTVQTQMPLEYKDVKLDCGYRLDLVVEDCLILELKAVDQILRIHEAQILTYMRLADTPLGLLINFNTTPLKNGIKRFRL